MIKKFFSFFSQEEFWVPVIIFVALLVSFSPFVYEVLMAARHLSESRYPLFETDFPPDQRVYLSRMRQGYEGKWLVWEKYTSEPHRPSLLHISYLLMGKITGVLGLTPPQAFPIWRLICGAFVLGSGYYFIFNLFSDKKRRLGAFLLFVFVGNLPVLAKTEVLFEVPFLGRHFTSFLAWYTFYDPVKRISFYPHYNLSAAFLSLAMIFFWRGIKKLKRWEFIKAGFFAFSSTIVLPQSLLIITLTAGFLTLTTFSSLISKLQREERITRIKNLVAQSLPFWLFALLSLALILFSLSYFPWNAQSLADLTKRYMGFDYLGVLLGLGTTGPLGLLGSIYIFLFRRKIGYLSAFWLLAILMLVLTFKIFPISNSYRPLQVELHLPLAVTSVIFLNDLAKLLGEKRKLIFGSIVGLMLLPSLLVWPISLRAQKLFVDAKIVAGYPLIPQKPFVVYPLKSVMEAIFWLSDKTNHEEVVLAAETLGSMIPAYAGNTVFIGHGNQTVYFEEKMAQMGRFYRGVMIENEVRTFLRENRIKYILFGPEEKEIAGAQEKPGWQLKTVFDNDEVAIFAVEGK